MKLRYLNILLTFLLFSQASANDDLFDLATTLISSENGQPIHLEGQKFRWDASQLKIAFYAEGKNKTEVLAPLSGPFELDRQDIQKASGIEFSFGLWGDTNPDPNIFVLIGNRDELLARADYLDRRFIFSDFVRELTELYESDRPLCTSEVLFDENNTILLAVVTVDTGYRSSYCLRRKLLMSIGIVGTVPDGTHSMLTAYGTDSPMTSLDKSFIRRLYKEGI